MYQVTQTGTKLALSTKGLFNEVGAQNIRQLAQKLAQNWGRRQVACCKSLEIK